MDIPEQFEHSILALLALLTMMFRVTCTSHAGPLKPLSHRQPTIFIASHGKLYSLPALPANIFSGKQGRPAPPGSSCRDRDKRCVGKQVHRTYSSGKKILHCTHRCINHTLGAVEHVGYSKLFIMMI